jgi:hypothetical protein
MQPLLPWMNILTIRDFWAERLPKLLDLVLPLEALPVADDVSPAATAEADYVI